MDFIKDKNNRFFQVISLPIIFSTVIPILILDIWAEVYHRICFPMYGLNYVKRGNYIKIDRHKLSYLSWYQKIGCVYCGYVNGMCDYWTEIAGQTEQYWCGIMHEKVKGFKSPKHHKDFVEYGDEESLKNKYKK